MAIPAPNTRRRQEDLEVASSGASVAKLALTPEDIGEFKALFRRETGRDITDEQAREYALSVLQMVALVVYPERISPDSHPTAP